jgi:hypothetical protein
MLFSLFTAKQAFFRNLFSPYISGANFGGLYRLRKNSFRR